MMVAITDKLLVAEKGGQHTMANDQLHLDANARRALFEAYRLLMALADEKTADSKEPGQGPQLSTAQDGAQKAPSQTGA